MAASIVTDSFKAPAETTWALLGDFDGMAAVFPVENFTSDGTRRTFDLMGMRITEELVARDESARSITYSIVDGVQIESHQATITVADGAEGGSAVTWAVSTVPAEAEPLFSDTYQRALTALHATLDA